MNAMQQVWNGAQIWNALNDLNACQCPEAMLEHMGIDICRCTERHWYALGYAEHQRTDRINCASVHGPFASEAEAEAYWN